RNAVPRHSFPTRRSSDLAASHADDKKVIRYIYKSEAHWWPPEIDRKIEEEAAKLNVDYQVVGPTGGDIGKQVEMIENFVSQNVRSEEHTSELQSRENLVC